MLQSLTPRHVELLRLLAQSQRDGARAGDAPDAPAGTLFKTLQGQCRYKMIAHTEDQIHQYLVELTDHNLVSKKVYRGSVYVAVTPAYVEPLLAESGTA